MIKLIEFSYEETLKMIEEETSEFLADYIYKINKVYNLLIDKVNELEEKNKLLNQMNTDNYNKYCELLKEKNK